MYIESFITTEEIIPDLIEQTISTIITKGVQVIECSDLVQNEPNIIILNTDEFFRLLEILRPAYVFLYRGFFEPWDAVRAAFSEEEEDSEQDDEEKPNLYEQFVELKRDVIERSIQICRGTYYFEIFILREGNVVSCGYISSAYQSLLDELNSFREKINEEAELIKRLKSEQKISDENLMKEEHDRLAQELIEDPAFKALRGKRKRCVYVRNKYGESLFKSGLYRRPDPQADYMDYWLVALVEKISDVIEVQNII